MYKGVVDLCGRYSLLVEEDIAELNQIIAELNNRYHGAKEKMKTGEIFPTNAAPILMPDREDIVPELGAWGFPGFRGKGVVINARAETAAEKRMFAKSLRERRCVIPSTGFYEWAKNKDKQKYLFRVPDTPMVYMAGVWNEFEGERRFVILTTEPNVSVADVHNRMPVVLPQGQISAWLTDTDRAMGILREVPPLLQKIVV